MPDFASQVVAEESGPASSADVSASPISLDQLPKRVQVNFDDSQVWGEPSYWETIKDSIPSEDAIRRLTVKVDDMLKASEPKFLAFDEFKESCNDKFIQIAKDQVQRPIWFIGDLHGDWLGLQSALHYIDHLDRQERNEGSIITFLGDLFDRGSGEDGAKVLFRVLSLIEERPNQIGFIVGNHDEGLDPADDDKFTSSVDPSEFADWLNSRSKESPWIGLAKVAIKFFECAPRALLLPDGLLVAHGGVPHTDWPIQSKDDFANPKILEDFVWTRLHENAKTRKPNRTTRGCSLGICDFDLFCETASKVLQRPIRGMLRGHDHYAERYRFFEKYQKHPVLTINTICYRQNGELLGPLARPVVIAKWDCGKMPSVHILTIPPALIERFYGSQNSESA
jgi:calcineurin-like phosphoesterase family protein